MQSFLFPYIMDENIPLKFRYSQSSESNVKAMEKPIFINMHNCRHKCYTTTPHFLFEEKCQWVAEARKLLQAQGKKGTRQEIVELLGVSESWVKNMV